jgi:hypothetical protein
VVEIHNQGFDTLCMFGMNLTHLIEPHITFTLQRDGSDKLIEQDGVELRKLHHVKVQPGEILRIRSHFHQIFDLRRSGRYTVRARVMCFWKPPGSELPRDARVWFELVYLVSQ